jgi:hypothetical protein
MKLRNGGASTSTIEVTNVSGHGFWIRLDAREIFLSFEYFPWFRDASIAQITNLECPTADHLYWQDLDIDLSVRSVEHPEEFPRAFQAR